MAAAAKGNENSLDVGTVARLLKIGPERVRQLSKDGWNPKVGRGKYPLVGAVHGYIDFLKDQERQTSKVAADARIKEERARQLKIRNDKDEGRLIDFDESMAAVEEIVGEIRANITALPARVTRDLKLRGSMDKEIDRIFARIHDRFEKSAAATQSRKPD